jgi:VIT1/CCC1 family predicted Fe2+/Mn2+ transporter
MGLYAGTKSEPAIIGGIITIAIADAFSDSLGIHISEESKCAGDDRHVWESTISTFLSKFVFALTFVIPVLTFCLRNAVIISVAWGFFLLVLANFYIARSQNKPVFNVIAEHILIAIVVLFVTYLVGIWVNATFM